MVWEEKGSWAEAWKWNARGMMVCEGNCSRKTVKDSLVPDLCVAMRCRAVTVALTVTVVAERRNGMTEKA